MRWANGIETGYYVVNLSQKQEGLIQYRFGTERKTKNNTTVACIEGRLYYTEKNTGDIGHDKAMWNP